MASPCAHIVGIVVLLSVLFTSLPAFVILLAGGVAMWMLQGKSVSDAPAAHGGTTAEDMARETGATPLTERDEDTLSVDSGILSARDFGITKGEATQPHRHPPLPPAAEVSAFRALKATPADGVDRNSKLYEHHTDARQFEERLNRGHRADLRAFYTQGLSAHIRALRKDMPLRDPNLLPLDPKEKVGCPRPLGKI